MFNSYWWSTKSSCLYQVGGNADGKFDDGSASLILDTKPSKVVSNELTVSSTLA